MTIKSSILSVTIVVSLISCNNANKSENKSETFDWLLGNWERTNEEQGKKTYEVWTKISDTSYSSIGYTMVNEDTVWQEQVLLVQNNTDWYFKVNVQNENSSTDFKLTQKTDTSFTCENLLNDFPKTINYIKNGPDFNAFISDGNTTIPYYFKKIK